ncbi:hypothetical protein MMC13_002802 [Lambiella insularis]|nr:hypothetical protein [Lambiella insularis]
MCTHLFFTCPNPSCPTIWRALTSPPLSLCAQGPCPFSLNSFPASITALTINRADDEVSQQVSQHIYQRGDGPCGECKLAAKEERVCNGWTNEGDMEGDEYAAVEMGGRTTWRRGDPVLVMGVRGEAKGKGLGNGNGDGDGDGNGNGNGGTGAGERREEGAGGEGRKGG